MNCQKMHAELTELLNKEIKTRDSLNRCITAVMTVIKCVEELQELENEKDIQYTNNRVVT